MNLSIAEQDSSFVNDYQLDRSGRPVDFAVHIGKNTMSISAVTGTSAAVPRQNAAKVIDPAPAVTPFSKQLESQTAEAQGHHPHHRNGAASQSVTSSAASVAGVARSGSTASSLLDLLS